MYQKTLLAVLAAAALSSVQAQTASDAPAAVQNAPAAESFGQKATSFLDSGYRKELGRQNPWRSRQIFSGTERKVAWHQRPI